MQKIKEKLLRGQKLPHWSLKGVKPAGLSSVKTLMLQQPKC